MSTTPIKQSYFQSEKDKTTNSAKSSSPDGKKSDRFIKPLPGGKIIAGSKAIPIDEYLKTRSNRGLRVTSDPNNPNPISYP